jgi:hypothetical protein
MDVMIVNNQKELIAAINAGARATHNQARENPFAVHLGTTKYTFKEGLHETRAEMLARHIKHTTSTAFTVEDQRGLCEHHA